MKEEGGRLWKVREREKSPDSNERDEKEKKSVFLINFMDFLC